jgi:phosphoglycolate phosphatase-like HAD superfamily hydrolase
VSRLILFDIDGTLVLTGGAGGRAMALAASDLFSANSVASVSMAGRTDAWIVAQMAAAHDVEYDDDLLQAFRELYLSHLQREIHEPGPQKGVLPGVRPLLDHLSERDDVHLALLTGNFEQGAQIKLEYFDLWKYFASGAFGDFAHDRNTLLDVAVTRFRAAGGPPLDPRDIVIVGDTPFDVAVAVAGGARSLAVATGPHGTDALRASGADVAVQDLTDRDAVLRGLGLAGPE